jgi:hypothetical protein
MFGETYSLRIITTFLQENGIEFNYCNSRVGIGMYNHGCGVKLDDTYKLSIQTHTDIIGSSFAEVALQNVKTQQLVYDGTYGFGDVIRFDTPQDLFDNILEVQGKARA